jgi:hypothetical protein
MLRSFPDDFIDPQKKDARWGVQVARAIWSRHSDGVYTYGSQDRYRIFRNRSYSAGKQDMEQYLDLLFGKKIPNKDGTGYERKGYANINPQIVSVAPKLKDIILGLMEEIDHEPSVESVDPLSKERRAEAKHTMWIKSKMQPILKELERTSGIAAPKMDFVANNTMSLDLYEMVGGFRLAHEIALEKLASAITETSQWKKLARLVRSDLWDNNRAVLQDVYDPYTNQVRTKYIDVGNYIQGWAGTDVNAQVPYAGHVEQITAWDAYNRLIASGHPVSIAQNIVKTCMANGYNGKYQSMTNDFLLGYNPNEQKPRYADMVLDVFNFDYITIDRKFSTLRISGEDVKYHPDSFGVVRDDALRMTQIIDSSMLYKGTWIIGTEWMIDWGKAEYMVRPVKNQVRISYHYIEVPGQSKVERIIPILDSMQLTHMKLQAAKQAAAPKGLAIDIQSVQNLNLGDGVVKPLELIRMYRQSGSVAYRSFTLHGKVVTQGNLPIRELEGGIGRQLEEWSMAWAQDMQKVMELTGFTDVSAASPDQSPEQLVGVAQIAMQQTNNSMKPLYEGLTTLKEDVLNGAIKRAITLISLNEAAKTLYGQIIGEGSVNAILSAKDIPLPELGIRLVAAPNQHQRNTLMVAATEALKVGKNGIPSIDLADFWLIESLVSHGKIKQAQAYLSYRSQEREAQNDRKANDMIALQSQSRIQEEQTKASLRIEEENAKQQAETGKEVAKIEALKGLEMVKHQNKLAQLTLEGELQAKYGVQVRGEF